MKLNNKGITLTEIIISIALISIVLIFLFSLLVTVNDINKESEVNSTYLINKSLILKNLESDFTKASKVSVDTCNISDFYENYNTYYNELELKEKANLCLKFSYSSDDNAYLGLYYYKNKNSYVISYIHGSVKATRLLPDFEKYNVDNSGNLKNNYEIVTTGYTGILPITLNGFSTITIPIIGSDEKDYSIVISYYGK